MTAAPAPARELGHASWEALGSTVVLRLNDSDPELLARARSSVCHELSMIDRACSRFRADSELSRLNALAGHPTRVGRLLLEAIELALRAAELTDGDVDPTVGRALELAGYDRDWRLLSPPQTRYPPAGRTPAAATGDTPTVTTGHTPSPGDGRTPCPPSADLGGPHEIRARAVSGWRTVSVDSSAARVRLPRGIRLDLGATAKAWAADRAAKRAATDAGCGVLVSLGGDIATCGDAPPGGWLIRVTDDHRSQPDAEGQTIAIRAGGLATSSVAVRRWRHRGQDMHHIIDPRTGEPTRSAWRTVSVAAASCAEANIAATAAIVRGACAVAWLSEMRLPTRLVDHEGRVLTICDWPDEQTGKAICDLPDEQTGKAIRDRPQEQTGQAIRDRPEEQP